MLNLILGLLVGLASGFAVVFIRAYTDLRVRTPRGPKEIWVHTRYLDSPNDSQRSGFRIGDPDHEGWEAVRQSPRRVSQPIFTDCGVFPASPDKCPVRLN